MELNCWKALAIVECLVAAVCFLLGIAWAMWYYGSDFYAGVAILSGVGFLNAALLTVIVDKLSAKGGGDGKKS